ncbi:MAG: hypothetical protein MPJ78_04535 [Hyphomicrobiaceae bacterium]|nr:hypothetical protein [Hyphomicrobiaceae bacterium]
MFRKQFAIKVSAIVFWTVAVSGANAFEQTPLPQSSAPAASPRVIAPSIAPNLSLDDQVKSPQPREKKQRGVKIPGLGKVTVPTLNFGLDLMYGSPESSDTELGFTNDTNRDDDDLTIMGKVKRRF